MAIPSSNSQVLTRILTKIEDIDVELTLAQSSLDNIGTQLHETEINYKRAAAVYERLRLERNRFLCELRGVDEMDIFSNRITLWRLGRQFFSERRLEELRKAGIVFIGDLVQAKVAKHHGKPLSLHPRLSDGTYREAGIPVIGKKTIAYLEKKLAEDGLAFEMSLPDWIRPTDLDKLPGEIRNHEELLNMEAGKFLRAVPSGVRSIFERHLYGAVKSPAVLVGDLVQMSEKEVLMMEYIGPKGLGYIKQALQESGLSLGMSLPNWIKNK